MAVIALGLVRLVAGIAGGKPVGFLLLTIIVLALMIPLLRIKRRRTALGDSELRRLKHENSYLSPKLRPAYTSYGPSLAGLSAALFGAGALVLIDPALAGAVAAGAAYSPGWRKFELLQLWLLIRIIRFGRRWRQWEQFAGGGGCGG